jgi:murein DD-endopeptidase MepM/ murein hydrolase activator NlpD
MLAGVNTAASGQKKDNRTQQEQIAPTSVPLIDRQASEMMARLVTPAIVASEGLAIERLEEYNRQLSRESLMFPADELYVGNWDTLHVNPFLKSTIEFPESYTIACQSFLMPIDNNVRVTSKYGPRGRRMHRGIDLDINKGDTIRASFDGKVRIKSYERRGYGYYLVLRHPNGLETVYGHLSSFLVTENQIVRAGQAIGLGGSTGRSSGSHLHFETRFLGKDINPAEIIDFENGVPHQDEYTFHNIKINGKKSNIYATSPNAVAIHRVKRGETLSQIARAYGTTVAELCSLNGITKSSNLAIGQAIQFRAKQVTVEASDNAVKQTPADKPAIKAEAKPAAKPAPAAKPNDKKIEVPIEETQIGNEVYHRIESGETLYNISKRYNTTIEKLCELNNIQNNTILKVGQKIRCS